MIAVLAAAAAALVAANWISLLIAAWRLAARGAAAPPLAERPPAPVGVPMCGVEPFTGETLARAFALDWPDYELIFCIASAGDPVIPLVRGAMADRPEKAARLIIGDEQVSANPKLNNCVKGWRAARHDWVVLADSNVLMPPDYLLHLFAAWRRDSGLVCSTPLGSRPDGFWAEVECAFLNTHQARWQYTGEALGFGFAQGKSMLWHKPMLDAVGGIEALGEEIAEDAAATKLVNRLGRKVHLVAGPFEQPLGRRRLEEIWSRQGRWARMRRETFPAILVPEAQLGVLPPLLFGVPAAAAADVSLTATIAAIAVAVYLPELALAAAKRWPLSVRSLPAMLARDMMLPAVWLRGWIGGAVHWRGNTMIIGTEGSQMERLPAA